MLDKLLSSNCFAFAATIAIIAAVVVPKVFPRWPLWARTFWSISTLLLLTYFIQVDGNSPFHPALHGQSTVKFEWERFLDAAWWLLAAQCGISLLRIFVVLEHRPRETQIISDLLAAAIYIATFFAIVNLVFSVAITGVLATSGVIAIVLGLALQSTLADVFSGIAVGIERPYKAGDLLWVEGDIEGHVLQVNWRSTHIATGNHNIAVVPNSVIAKARLINHSRPSAVRSAKLEITLDANVMQGTCLPVLLAAAKACKLPLSTHGLSITQTRLAGDGATYAIDFSVSSSDKLGAARTELFAKMQIHLRHAGIPLAVPGLSSVARLPIPAASDLLEQSELFTTLTRLQRDLIASHLKEEKLALGHVLMRQGDTPHALYVIAAGTVEITTTVPRRSHLVYRVSPGETLGAIALITDFPYGATATALTPVRAYSLGKTELAAALASQPDIASGLEALAERSQAALTGDEGVEGNEQLEHPELFLSRVRSFLHRLSLMHAPA